VNHEKQRKRVFSETPCSFHNALEIALVCENIFPAAGIVSGGHYVVDLPPLPCTTYPVQLRCHFRSLIHVNCTVDLQTS